MTTAATTAITPGGFVSRGRRFIVLCAVLLLAVPTGLVAVGEGVGALALPFNLFVVDVRLPGVFKLHMLASGAALLLIPLVIAVRRDRYWHRPLGRLAAAAVVVGALTSLPVAIASDSVVAARLGFLAQGLVWLCLIVVGVMSARRRQLARHAQTMLAMAAVASGALWVRVVTAIATSYALPFDPVYGCVAWAGWLVPLALVSAFPGAVVRAIGSRARR